MAANGTQNMTELETFLPQDGSNYKDGNKYKVTVVSKDAEGDSLNRDVKGQWDPFKERRIDHPTTDFDTLAHLLKSALGTGILGMPIAFKFAGMATGVFATILVAIICTHCAYILVKCAHELYRRTRVTAMSFADVGEVAFANGPPWGRKFAKTARIAIMTGLFAAYYGSCSVYTVIIGTNFQQVIEHFTEYHLNERWYIGALLIPMILLGWVPNLKFLAPFSAVANGFMGIGLGITMYYLVWDLTSPWEMPQFASLYTLPQFFSITIFAMEAIGVVMPLENNMKTPQHFIGICGVLNQGMAGVTLLYIMVGFLGYLKYGDETQGSITLNLPQDEIAAQSVKILIALAVFVTYGLAYYVCLEIIWNGMKEKFPKNTKCYEYIIRTLLAISTVVVAVAVPTIGPFMGLIGALCFSLLGLVIPVFIEMVTFWDVGFGPCYWIIWKNIVVVVFGLMALVFGSYTSILDIIAVYIPDNPIIEAAVNITTNSTI